MNRKQQRGGMLPALAGRFAWWFAVGFVFVPRVWHYVEQSRLFAAVVLAAVGWAILITGGIAFRTDNDDG